MQREFMERLAMGDRGTRLKAWRELVNQPEVSHGLLTTADRQELHDVLEAEADDDVRLFGMLKMLRFGTVGAVEAPAPKSRRCAAGSLDAWFARLFQGRSAVLWVSEENYSRRDEYALVYLARRFPNKEFLEVDFSGVALGDDSWLPILLERNYQTILMLGRLWLYGERAIKELQGSQLHLDFPEKQRPTDLGLGDLHPDYHWIRETINKDGQELTQDYRTSEDDRRIRTDYGLVQVYPVSDGRGRRITFVRCAGCSTLGTLAAARWLGLDLGLSLDNNTSRLIPAPRAIRPDSRMEALVKVTAPFTTGAWQPSQIELCRLFVDDELWMPQEFQWQGTKRHEVQMIRRGGKPVELYVDGQKVNMLPGSQNFRLATTLVLLLSESSNHRVALQSLVEERSIWQDRAVSPSKVKQLLHNLNHNSLHDLLIIGDEIGVNATVTVVDE